MQQIIVEKTGVLNPGSHKITDDWFTSFNNSIKGTSKYFIKCTYMYMFKMKM